jgi:hypothetical protein
VILLTGHAAAHSASEGIAAGSALLANETHRGEKLMEKLARVYKRKAEHEERIRQADIGRVLVSWQHLGTV